MSDEHREEIRKLEALYAEHPEGRIFTHLAEAYRKSGELEQARAVLEEGIERHPDYSSAHVVLGRVLLDQGLDADAAAEFQRVLELDAHNMVALRSLGDLARTAGRRDEALEYYHRLLEIEPADADVRALVEEVEFGTAPAAPADEAPAETGDVWAPLGMVEGPAFEDAAWALSEEGAAEAEPPERETEPAGATEPPEGAGAESPWVPFGTTLPDEEPLPGDEAAGEAVDEEAAGDEAAEWPEAAAGWDAGIPDWEEAEEAEEAEDAHAFEDAGAADQPTGAGLDVDAPPTDPFASSAFAGVTGEGGEDGEDEESAPTPASPGVMTETIAQVYARQGLYDRAADVYRGLVRERPNDAGLRERLAEMEALASRSTGSAGEGYGSGEPREEVERAGAAGLDDLPGLETTEVDAGAAETVPIEGLEVSEVDPATHLLEAGPTEPVEFPFEADVRDVPAPPEEEPWAGEVEDVEDVEEGGADAEPWSRPVDDAGYDADDGAEEATAEEPWATESWTGEPVEPAQPADVAGEREPAEGGEGAEAPSVEEASVWTGGDWSEPEAETPYAWAEPSIEAETDDTPPIQGYFRGLLAWDRSARAATEEPSAPSSAPAPKADAAGERDAGAVAPEPPSGPDEGEDDDLEMFRSWLESLKQ